MPADRGEIAFDLSRQTIVYREGRRRAEVRCDVDDGWWLRAESLAWWDLGDRRREPVTPPERRMILDRIVAAGREAGRWIGLAGEPRPARPAPIAPPRAAGDEVEQDLDGISPPVGVPDPELVPLIDQALARIEPLAEAWEVAASIARQLRWCRGTVLGLDVEPAPGPLSMGLMATREFDMYGDDPDFARLINRIQDAIRVRGSSPG